MYPLDYYPCTILVSGSTGSGKSTLACKFIKYRKEMFPNDPPVRIIYCYNQWQDLYSFIQKEYPEVEFVQGIIPKEQLINKDSGKGTHMLAIFDDLITDISNSNDFEETVLVLSHHKNITVLFLSQNIYYQGKKCRSISLNTHNLILFDNKRDRKQIRLLGNQLFVGNQTKGFYEAYEDIHKEGYYNYLFVDVSPKCNPEYALRTNIFPDEGNTIVYKLKN